MLNASASSVSSVICCHGPAGPGFPLSSPALKVFLELFSPVPFLLLASLACAGSAVSVPE